MQRGLRFCSRFRRVPLAADPVRASFHFCRAEGTMRPDLAPPRAALPTGLEERIRILTAEQGLRITNTRMSYRYRMDVLIRARNRCPLASRAMEKLVSPIEDGKNARGATKYGLSMEPRCFALINVVARYAANYLASFHGPTFCWWRSGRVRSSGGSYGPFRGNRRRLSTVRDGASVTRNLQDLARTYARRRGSGGDVPAICSTSRTNFTIGLSNILGVCPMDLTFA